jgi:hypothetical protein
MTRILFLFFTAIMLTACSDGRPFDWQIRSKVIDHYAADADYYTISDFEKVNGIVKDEHTYIASVRYKKTYRVSFDDMAASIENKAGNSFVDKLKATLKLGVIRAQEGNFEKGAVVMATEDITFLKTDNGWIIEQ